MTDQVDYKLKVDMSPVQDFENGMSLIANIKAGSEIEPLLETYPDYFKSSPVTVGVEINVKNQETGGLIIQTIENLKGMIFAIPQVETFINMGLQINTRQTNDSVCVDISIGGALAEQVAMALSIMGNYKLNGKGDLELVTGFKPVDALTQSFEQTLQKLCQFKVKVDTHFSSEKEALDAFYNNLGNALKQVPGLPPKIEKFSGALKALTIIKDITYEYKYDTQEFLNGALELIKFAKPEGETDYVQEISGKVAEGQMMVGMGIEQGKMMAGMFLAPFAEALKAANFDKIGIFGYVSEMKMLYKVQLNLPGVDDYLNENFLSSL
jgi:hypothetical protein